MTLQRVNVWLAIALAILVVVGLCLPGIRFLRDEDARTRTKNNLKQMGLAMQSCHDTYKRLPPAFDQKPGVMRHPVSVHVHLLPYLDQQAVFTTFLTEGRGDSTAVVPAFIAATDGTLGSHAGVQNFAANLRVFSDKGGKTPSAQDMPPLATIEPGSRTFVGITNGTSNTIAFATKLAECGEGGSRYAADPTSPYAAFFGQNAARTTAHYSNPQSTFQWAPRGEECRCSPLMAQTYFPEPIFACFADGMVRAMPGNFDTGSWNMFMHPTGP